ncbi:MAG: hypothetical protein E7513_03760 [Ruminococcaceae bacterium]|nr:hypothetical protein [Oscillospiraceae bacterium]
MKRTISILLAVLLLVSCAVISASAADEEAATPSYSWNEEGAMTITDALAKWEAENGAVTKNRYYFLMPNGSNGELGDNGEYAPSWYNEFTGTAGIYWWDSGVADPAAWIGYIPNKCANQITEADIYYADVPVDVTGVVWNNGVNGGMDDTQDIYYKAAQSVNVGTEYYDPGESDYYPDGTENFNGMIYVIDPDLVDVNELSLKQTCGGEWYYYYGSGCYGITKDGKAIENCLRDDHLNADGTHIEFDSNGDADGSGVVDIEDVTCIQKHVAEVEEIPADRFADADTDKDGEITVVDAVRLQKALAGIITL